jgi:hypothetical protein
MKWSVGRPRPEEIAMQIQNDDITELDGVPAGVVKAVKAMHLTRAQGFTHYDEGCPLHPSWPAMHSAQRGVSLARGGRRLDARLVLPGSPHRLRGVVRRTVQASITRLRVYLLGTIWARRFLRDSQTRCSFDGKYEERILRLFSREIDSLILRNTFFC